MPCRVQMARYKKLEQGGGCTSPITWIGIPECNADAEELKDTVIGDCCQADLAQVHFVQAGWRDFSACWRSKVHQLKQVGLGRVSENFFFTYRTLLESPWMLVCFAVTC
jgi:hypothetical protein